MSIPRAGLGFKSLRKVVFLGCLQNLWNPIQISKWILKGGFFNLVATETGKDGQFPSNTCVLLSGAAREQETRPFRGAGARVKGGVEVGKKLSRVQGGRQGMGKRMYFRSGWSRRIHGRVTAGRNDGKRLHLAKIIRDEHFNRPANQFL